ncbi:MAG: hypothetical protein PHW02_06940 [bacterium]|nr:hypothetical protein [bacterium]
MKRALVMIFSLISICAGGSELFVFQSKILPTELMTKSRFFLYLGADFLSYNFLAGATKSSDKLSLTAGIEYIEYGGIITAKLADTSDNPLFKDPAIAYDTLSLRQVRAFGAYGASFDNISFDALLGVSYSDFMGSKLIESSVDAGIKFSSYFDFSFNIMDILPVIYRSSDFQFSYRPYGLFSAGKMIYESQSFELLWSINIYGYYNSYAGQQMIHGKFAFSRGMGAEARFEKAKISGEFFSEKIILSASYSVSDRASLYLSYSGNSTLSSTKFGVSWFY